MGFSAQQAELSLRMPASNVQMQILIHLSINVTEKAAGDSSATCIPVSHVADPRVVPGSLILDTAFVLAQPSY